MPDYVCFFTYDGIQNQTVCSYVGIVQNYRFFDTSSGCHLNVLTNTDIRSNLQIKKGFKYWMKLETGQNWDYENKRSLKLTFHSFLKFSCICRLDLMSVLVKMFRWLLELVSKNPLFRTMDSLIWVPAATWTFWPILTLVPICKYIKIWENLRKLGLWALIRGHGGHVTYFEIKWVAIT